MLYYHPGMSETVATAALGALAIIMLVLAIVIYFFWRKWSPTTRAVHAYDDEKLEQMKGDKNDSGDKDIQGGNSDKADDMRSSEKRIKEDRKMNETVTSRTPTSGDHTIGYSSASPVCL